MTGRGKGLRSAANGISFRSIDLRQSFLIIMCDIPVITLIVCLAGDTPRQADWLLPEGDFLMRYVTCNNFVLILAILHMLPIPALAIPAITCHCFTDRSFEPARPAAADPYFLATTQNSFFAVVFATDRKSIVMKKQQGTSSDDLWIAYWVASRSGASPENLLQARLKNGVWKDILAPLRLSTKAAGTRFSKALNEKASASRLAETVVDELFLRYQLLGEGELAALRQAGASSQELIIATVIAARTKQSAKGIFLEVENRSKTWGSLLQGAKIDTKNMQQEISGILKLHHR